MVSWGGHFTSLLRRAFGAGLILITLFSTFAPPAHAEDDEGSQSGKNSAQMLFGLAAIMAAVSPMVAAAIQADADKQIAKTNANAQIKMTQISSDTSKFLADNQKQVALQQAETAKAISKENQDSATRRLQAQLNELRVARQENNQIEDKKFAYQQRLDQERLALAKQQADETVRLANSQMRAQLSAAGVSQGFSRTINSASGVAVRSSFGIPTGASSSAVASTSTGLPVGTGGLSGTGTGLPTGSAVTNRRNPLAIADSSSVGNRAGTGSSEPASRSRSASGGKGRGASSGETGSSGSVGSAAEPMNGVALAAAGPPPALVGALGKPATKAEEMSEFEKTLIDDAKKKGKMPVRGLASPTVK